MEEYIEILKFKGYKYYPNDEVKWNKLGKDQDPNGLVNYVDFAGNKIEISCLDFNANVVYSTGYINLDINEFRMLLDLFWREYETK